MVPQLCDFCKSATATLYCRADTAFLCVSCDGKVHAANELDSRHPRLWLCEVCEQAPVHVTCKADAAALCVTCDRDIHSANPLARRHERVAVAPFYHTPAAVGSSTNYGDDRYYSDEDEVRREEAEVASWLLPNPNHPAKPVVEGPGMNTGQHLFTDMDPYQLDLVYAAVDPKLESRENSSGTDRVVPVQPPFLNDHCFDSDHSASKACPYGYSCIRQTVSSSSTDIGVVPDGGAMAEISNPYGMAVSTGSQATKQFVVAVQLSSADREARVLRYREKRKTRKFEKTIRYASRKAYAEMRPRIRGRFAKRTNIGSAAGSGVGVVDVGFGVVPSF